MYRTPENIRSFSSVADPDPNPYPDPPDPRVFEYRYRYILFGVLCATYFPAVRTGIAHLKISAALEKQCIIHSSIGSTMLPRCQWSRTYGRNAFSNMAGWLQVRLACEAQVCMDHVKQCCGSAHHSNADPDSTYHPETDPDSDFLYDADPNTDPSLQIKAQPIEKVL
jgi:hypothetical protein